MPSYYRSPLYATGISESLAGSGLAYYFHCASTTVDAALGSSPGAVKYYRKGFLNKAQIYIFSNSTSASSTLNLRINGVNSGISITIGAGATGFFEEVTTMVEVNAGDTLDWAFTVSNTGTIVFEWVGVDFLSETSFSKHVASANETFSTASGTRQGRFCGENTFPTSGNVTSEVSLVSGTAKNLDMYVYQNPRSTNTTFTLLKNGSATALTVTVPAGGTGRFEDTSNTVSVSYGDQLEWEAVNGTGSGAIGWSHIGCEIESATNGEVMLSAGYNGGSAATASRYLYLTGFAGSPQTNEARRATRFYGSGTISRLRMNVTANGRSSGTDLFIRKNGADTAVTVNYPASTTGIQEDISNSASFSNGDSMNLRSIYSGAGTGNLTHGVWSAVLTQTAEKLGQVKVWNGSSWVAKPVKVWNGSAWVEKPTKYYNGTAWEITPY